MTPPNIVLSSQDVERLNNLLDTLSDSRRETVQGLESEIARARVVEPAQVPRDVVTMNSHVVYEDVESGKANEAVLVYPNDADIASGRVSVLAPLGSALLGLKIGQTIDWPMPSGRHRQIRVIGVPYQPEAAGHFHL